MWNPSRLGLSPWGGCTASLCLPLHGALGFAAVPGAGDFCREGVYGVCAQRCLLETAARRCWKGDGAEARGREHVPGVSLTRHPHVIEAAGLCNVVALCAVLEIIAVPRGGMLLGSPCRAGLWLRSDCSGMLGGSPHSERDGDRRRTSPASQTTSASCTTQPRGWGAAQPMASTLLRNA